MLLKRRPIALQPLAGALQVHAFDDDRDLPVAELQQMRRRQKAAHEIVDEHGVHRRTRHLAGDDGDRQLPIRDQAERFRMGKTGREQDAVHAFLLEKGQILTFLVHVIVGIADHDIVTQLMRPVLDIARELGEIRIRYIRKQQADHERFLAESAVATRLGA